MKGACDSVDITDVIELLLVLIYSLFEALLEPEALPLVLSEVTELISHNAVLLLAISSSTL